MRVWLWLVDKITENHCLSRLLAEFIQIEKKVSYLSWQNTYPNMKTTSRVKLKFFLWTKFLKNLLLAKYLISVAAPLSILPNIEILSYTMNCKVTLIKTIFFVNIPSALRVLIAINRWTSTRLSYVSSHDISRFVSYHNRSYHISHFVC